MSEFAADAVQLLSCPYTHPHTDVQPVVETMLVAWMNYALLGMPLGPSWTPAEGGFLENKWAGNPTVPY